MAHDFNDTIKWCIENEITLTFSVQAGLLAVTARGGNIAAHFAIDGEPGQGSVGAAVLNAIHSVEHGTKFHQRFGHFPPIEEPTGGAADNDGISVHYERPDGQPPAPDFPGPVVPERP